MRDLEVVRVLLNHGANVNAKDNWDRAPLHRVFLEDEDVDVFGVAQLLVERGADVNARDENHETPLHLASCFPVLLKLVRVLVDLGADVKRTTGVRPHCAERWNPRITPTVFSVLHSC